MLTKEKILAMPAGREMDALIAERVFGEKCPDGAPQDIPWPGTAWTAVHDLVNGAWIFAPRKFSTDISAAWEVVEKFEEVDLANSIDAEWWTCTLRRHREYFTASLKNNTAPLAICRAALLVKMNEN